MVGFFESIPLALLAPIEQAARAWTEYDLTVQTPNGIEVDQNLQVHPYLAVEIKPLAGGQLDLSGTTDQWGQLILSAVVREGAGWRRAEQLLDTFVPFLQHQALGCVQVYTAQRLAAKNIKGWAWYPALFTYRAINIADQP